MSPEYRTWANMIQRCHNPNGAGFERYGGSGITVCEQWRNSFSKFLSDVGKRPSPAYSIDRIDPFGNYTPGNVRWATRWQQANNKRHNVCVAMGSESVPIAVAAKQLGLSLACARTRLVVGKPLSDPPRGHIRFGGECLHYNEWAKRLGCRPGALRNRICRGWTEHETITTPIRAWPK